MKKFIIGFLVLSIGVFVLFTFLGKDKGHDAEKVLWGINQEFNTIANDPAATPENAFVELSKKYENFVQRFPDADVTPGAYIIWARLMVIKEDYDRAKSILEKVLSKYPENKTAQLEALLEVGKVQTIQKDELGVLDTYQRVIRNFPKSEVGLKTPLLVAQYYLEKKQNNLMEKAFDDAITHYQALIADNKGEKVGFYALQYLAVCHIAQKNWDGALSAYEASLLDYADLNVWTPQSLLKLLRAYNTIYVTHKKSIDGPVDVYQKFIDDNPDHAFNPILERVIKTLQELKADGVITPDVTVQSLEKAVNAMAQETEEKLEKKIEQQDFKSTPATVED